MSENTLLAELTVSIRLYENDYIDNSAYMQFSTLFGSKIDENFAIFNEKESQIKLSQEMTVILSDRYMETMSSRTCNLETYLNLHKTDALEDQ